MGKRRNRWRLALVGIGAAIGMVVTGVVVSLATAEPPAAESASADPSPKDREAVLRLWARQFDAWERGSGADYARTFTADGEMVVFDGTHVRTRDGIARYMRFAFETFLRDTRLSAEPETMRLVAPRTIVMISRGCVLQPGETACPMEALSRQTNVAVERYGRWLFTSFQNTRIEPPTGTTAR